jgi:hypothetical protein
VSRYRSEIDSLRRRERELRAQLRAFDRDEGIGRYATSRSGRFGYRLGRAVGGLWRRVFGDDEQEAARLREEVAELERRVADRRQERAEREEVEAIIERQQQEEERAAREGPMFRAGRGLRNAWKNWGGGDGDDG